MTVLEPLRCPGCSTRYVLGAARVRPGIRRARCFRCDSVFSVEESVARLLAPAPGEQTPPLTLDDLTGIQDEFLEAPAAPFVPAPAPDPAPAETPYAATGNGYASAKDAIDRLMGSAPAQAPPVQRMGGRGSMDVEATLDALSTTLGGAPEPHPAPRSDMASTVKLTSEEIKVAMASMGDLVRPEEPAAPARPAPPAPAEPPAPPVESAQGIELLKIQLEQETCQNVTLEQMTAWIEQGRVLEYHMVARQFSEHWIEASKVPALRPIFDRVRKVREAQAEEAPKPVPEPPPVKRGLFAGLFGRR